MPYFTTADGTNIRYQDWGDGNPVVFVSAWALSSSMWQYQMIEIAEAGLRCVAYDRRGHGRSDQPARGYDYDTLADDLARLIEELDLRQLTLVSYSMGAGEIVRYLTRYGDERVAGVALCAPSAPCSLRADDNPNGFDPTIVDAVRAGWKKDFAAWMEAGTPAYVGDGLPGCRVSEGLVDWTKRDMLQTSLVALIEFNRSGVETDFRMEMTKIAVPTLIVDGDHDASIPTELSGMVCADLIAGATFNLYENAPHGLYLTHRDRLTDDLLSFVRSLRG